MEAKLMNSGIGRCEFEVSESHLFRLKAVLAWIKCKVQRQWQEGERIKRNIEEKKHEHYSKYHQYFQRF